MLPPPIKKFVELFAALPSIGPRQATRLAFYIIGGGKSKIEELAKAIFDLSAVKTCSQCFFTYGNRYKNIPISSRILDSAGIGTNASESANSLCGICSNPQRRQDIIAIVEKETDLISLEKTKKFNGRYLILGDLKKDGILDTVQKLRLNSLKNWIKKSLIPELVEGQQKSDSGNSSTSLETNPGPREGKAQEIILAINSTTYGDLNAGLIAQELKNAAKKITRLGRGIPTGGEIEFADEDTLGSALDNRG